MKRTMIALALISSLFGLGSTAASAAEFCVQGIAGVTWIRPARASKCTPEHCVTVGQIHLSQKGGMMCGEVAHLRAHKDWCFVYNGTKYVGKVRGRQVVFGG